MVGSRKPQTRNPTVRAGEGPEVITSAGKDHEPSCERAGAMEALQALGDDVGGLAFSCQAGDVGAGGQGGGGGGPAS